MAPTRKSSIVLRFRMKSNWEVSVHVGIFRQSKKQGLYEHLDNSLCVGLHHNIAVDQDGADNGEGEEGMGEDVNSNPKHNLLCIKALEMINFKNAYFNGKI